ncbi:hypothetical protein [Halobacillus salinus]|uniref:hypothetical protein n=1 Tax=Halobacillus salinus TaxID=192814 RepID=UPI0009A5A905|nr:hypothetical protein [Halobacillus salinus]
MLVEWRYYRGNVTQIKELDPAQGGCQQLVSVEDGTGNRVDFMLTEDTYLMDHQSVKVGDFVTGYYDGLAPVPLIYPPRYRALVLVKEVPYRFVKVDDFNEQLVSSDGRLKLNLSPYTQVSLKNGQAYTSRPANHSLVVSYGTSTKSIPAQTTPYGIVVLCF